MSDKRIYMEVDDEEDQSVQIFTFKKVKSVESFTNDTGKIVFVIEGGELTVVNNRYGV